jgi:hypothetical protein
LLVDYLDKTTVELDERLQMADEIRLVGEKFIFVNQLLVSRS